MNREIKFRAWKVWNNGLGDENMFPPRTVSEISSGKYDYSNTTLMQYTGLKDKNGVEIYEGDIVKEEYVIERIDGSMSDNTNKTVGAVSFKVHEDDGYEGFYAYGWFLGDMPLTPKIVKGFYSNLYWNVKKGDSAGYEVIGNIYENPELLK